MLERKDNNALQEELFHHQSHSPQSEVIQKANMFAAVWNNKFAHAHRHREPLTESLKNLANDSKESVHWEPVQTRRFSIPIPRYKRRKSVPAHTAVCQKTKQTQEVNYPCRFLRWHVQAWVTVLRFWNFKAFFLFLRIKREGHRWSTRTHTHTHKCPDPTAISRGWGGSMRGRTKCAYKALIFIRIPPLCLRCPLPE